MEEASLSVGNPAKRKFIPNDLRRRGARDARGAPRLAVLVALTITWAVPSASAAQSEADAQRARFEAAMAAFDAERFEEAAAGFEALYAATGAHELLFNLYLASRGAGELREAESALDRYLRNAPNDEAHASLEADLEELRAELSASAEPESNDVAEADVERPPAPAAAVGPPPPSAPRDTPASQEPWWVAIGLTGAVALGAALTSAVAGGLALERAEQLDRDFCSEGRGSCRVGFEVPLGEANTWAEWSNGAGLLALASAIGAGITALVFALNEEPSLDARVAATPEGLAIGLAGALE